MFYYYNEYNWKRNRRNSDAHWSTSTGNCLLIITILDQVANFRLRVYTMKRVDADLKRKDELKAALNIDNNYEQED